MIILLMIIMNYVNSYEIVYYESSWQQYVEPEEAGWSSSKLFHARKYFDRLNSTSAILIHDGKVVVAWGDVTKNTNAHSIRKSFLNALYGIYVAEGYIDINEPIDSLNIQENLELSLFEKQAKISYLLSSRSGIYLPAGEESRNMARLRPQREFYSPGTYFYYNNWDFNILGSILNDKIDSDLFVEFKERIANPLGMEDFSLDATEYKFDLNRSMHPSYLFRMSSRDMAKFGQLYLQQGYWEEQQIIPHEWIKESTQVHSPSTEDTIYGYGYLWWVADKGEFADLDLYSAIGRYGQSIDIIPEKNLVFVHRVDTNNVIFPYLRRVENSERLKLLKMVLDAKVSDSREQPQIRQGIISLL